MPKIGEFAVHVLKDGVTHSFLPGEDVPSWAAKQMGDHCFAHDGDDDGASDGPPSKRSGLPKWVAYAEEHGVDVDGLDKAGIIADLEAAGVSVE